MKDSNLIISASVQGNGHIASKVPCQDAHKIKEFDAESGILIVSDGAGSHKYSHFSSRFIVNNVARKYTKIVLSRKWNQKGYFPDENTWRFASLSVVRSAQRDLRLYAKIYNRPFKQLGCTIIAMIYTPEGLLSMHIGDGRAGYLDRNKNWKSLINPFQGSEVGETVFLTSNIFANPERFIETKTIRTKYKAVTLMSDGCEYTAWRCVEKDGENNGYHNVNLPYEPFFNDTIKGFKKLCKSGVSKDEIRNMFSDYLKDGHPGFLKEQDDKTMIIGVFNH